MRRGWMVAGVLALLAAGCTSAGGGVGVQVRVSPWLWLSGWWSPPPPAAPPPDLAVVVTRVRPRRARVVLDGRVIGLADDFDGYPDCLYLRPGEYTLRFDLGGYRTREVPLEVRAGNVYEVRLRLERDRTRPKEGWRQARASAPRVAQRVFGPAGRAAPGGRGREAGSALRVAELGSLELRVSPPEAEVLIDGDRYATARELESLGHPIALPGGLHVVEVRAAGFASERREVRIEPGATVRLEVELQRATGTDRGAGTGPPGP